jgi:hypothetical protein
VQSIGRFFRSDVVAGGDQATAETDPGLREQTRTSADGRWWWDGERWLSTSTPDGLWQWDGERWRPTIELRGVRSRDLATTLAFLAEDRYARAAALLVDRQREWRPHGEVRALVQQATSMRGRLHRVERAFGAVAGGAPGLLRRMRARPEERERIEEEQALLDTRYRALLVHLGRHAPRPTIKEADDLLEVARLLDHRAAMITNALAAADEAERARALSIEAAQRELSVAETARRDAVASAARELARAEEAHAQQRRAMRGRLRDALSAPAGEPMAQVGPLRAHATFIETPGGHLAADDVRASVASAVALWRQHREVLQDLLLVEGDEAGAFERCLTERRRDLFLLLDARSTTLLWRCPPGEEKPLRRFATAVNRQAGRAAGPAQERLQEAERVRQELAGQGVGASEAAAAARAELIRAEADGRLTAALEEARRRLEWAKAEPAELVAARQHAAAEVRSVTTPPLPLTATAGSR